MAEARFWSRFIRPLPCLVCRSSETRSAARAIIAALGCTSRSVARKSQIEQTRETFAVIGFGSNHFGRMNAESPESCHCLSWLLHASPDGASVASRHPPYRADPAVGVGLAAPRDLAGHDPGRCGAADGHASDMDGGIGKPKGKQGVSWKRWSIE